MVNRIKQIFQRQSEFTRNVATVMSGTVLAQIIPLLASLVIVRLYDASEFGIFTLIVSLITFGAVVGTGRYEVAIMLPEEDSKSRQLSTIAVVLGFIFCLFLEVLVMFAIEPIGAALGMNPADQYWLYWVPLLIFLAILYQVLNLNAARSKKFKVLAYNKMGRAVSMSLTQIGLGLTKFSGGLIWGNMVAAISSVSFLKYKQGQVFDFSGINKLKATAKEYIKFPKYSLLAGSINSFSNHIPVVLMIRLFSDSVAGYFGLTIRILSLPLTLIAASFTDVFRQKAAEEYNTTGSCRGIYMKMLLRLSLISIPSFSLLALLAPTLFAVLFGEEWRQSGDYARILCLMFGMRFIASPLSYIIYIVGKQSYDLFWQIALGVVTLVSFYIGGRENDPEIALWCFSLSYSFLYLIYLFMSFRFSKSGRQD